MVDEETGKSDGETPEGYRPGAAARRVNGDAPPKSLGGYLPAPPVEGEAVSRPAVEEESLLRDDDEAPAPIEHGGSGGDGIAGGGGASAALPGTRSGMPPAPATAVPGGDDPGEGAGPSGSSVEESVDDPAVGVGEGPPGESPGFLFGSRVTDRAEEARPGFHGQLALLEQDAGTRKKIYLAVAVVLSVLFAGMLVGAVLGFFV